MVIAPSKKNTISLTSADACVNSETAISVEGACIKKSWTEKILICTISIQNQYPNTRVYICACVCIAKEIRTGITPEVQLTKWGIKYTR